MADDTEGAQSAEFSEDSSELLNFARESFKLTKEMSVVAKDLATVAEALAYLPVKVVSVPDPLSHCPGCRCGEQAVTVTNPGLRDRLEGAGELYIGGSHKAIPIQSFDVISTMSPTEHERWEQLIKHVRERAFDTLGKRQEENCTHGVKWEDMPYQHWAIHHKGDNP